MAKSDGAEQAVDGNVQEGATSQERKEKGSGPTNSPNAGPLGAHGRWWADLPQLPLDPEGRPAEQWGALPFSTKQTHYLLPLHGGC